MSWSVMNRCTQDVNGRSEGSASTSSSSRRSRTPRNVLPDRESKSTNITKLVGIRINDTNSVNLRYRWHLRFLWLWIFRVKSSESWFLVVWHVGTNISKETTASVLRVEDLFSESGGSRPLWNVFTHLLKFHSVISRKGVLLCYTDNFLSVGITFLNGNV